MRERAYSERTSLILYCILLALVIADRWFLLDHFTFQFVDDDQSIMWYAAKEFSMGHFYEPCFYGQSYNTLAESLCAVPLIWLGVSYPVALTWMMSIFALIPFVVLSWIFFRRQEYFKAFFMLLIPLALPVEYGMVTAISRGAATGILFAFIGVAFALTQSRFRYAWFAFLSITGIFANPSAVLLAFPVGVWLLMENFRQRNFYVQSLAGAVPAALIWFFAKRFYEVHPEYLVHPPITLSASLSVIKPYEWNKFFDYVTPFLWNLGWLLFPLLIALAVILLRQNNRSAGCALFAGVVLLFFSLTISKVHHGYPTVFLSWARMFFAIPVLIAVFTTFIRTTARMEKLAPVLLIVSLGFFIVKSIMTDSIVHRELVEKTEHAMYVAPIAEVQVQCDTIANAVRTYHAELIVVGNHYMKHLLTYGCPCLNEELPRIIQPELDRRTWLLDDEAPQVRKTILFVGLYYDMIPAALQQNTQARLISADPVMYILENNNQTTEALLRQTGFPLRPH